MDKLSKGRIKRKKRIRKKISGTPKIPRLSVFRSAKHMYAQIIDDVSGVTLASASTCAKNNDKKSGSVDGAKKVGYLIAERAKAKKIEKIIFDRNGYQYHGRVQALADAAREKGLKF